MEYVKRAQKKRVKKAEKKLLESIYAEREILRKALDSGRLLDESWKTETIDVHEGGGIAEIHSNSKGSGTDRTDLVSASKRVREAAKKYHRERAVAESFIFADTLVERLKFLHSPIMGQDKKIVCRRCPEEKYPCETVRELGIDEKEIFRMIEQVRRRHELT